MAGTGTTAAIDLNADLGEGLGVWKAGDDNRLLEIVTSANVACGFHAGDPTIMRDVCAKASAAGVTIGAHVGYRDLVGFGRRDLAVSQRDLRNETIYQIAALDAMAVAEHAQVRYVKPHGALYHRVSRSDEAAAALVQAILDYNPGLEVLGAPGSALARQCSEYGIRFRNEGFADRRYRDDGSLVERFTEGAILATPEAAAAQAVAIARHQQVHGTSGASVPVAADSICVHGETPHAVDTAREVRASLIGAGVAVRAFAR
ncbi:LamB/YcsF family protein [Rhodococcus pyridinivorans]|nr:LamB/YcsF family protein [Rhodococcus pyridinivorans]